MNEFVGIGLSFCMICNMRHIFEAQVVVVVYDGKSSSRWKIRRARTSTCVVIIERHEWNSYARIGFRLSWGFSAWGEQWIKKNNMRKPKLAPVIQWTLAQSTIDKSNDERMEGNWVEITSRKRIKIWVEREKWSELSAWHAKVELRINSRKIFLVIKFYMIGHCQPLYIFCRVLRRKNQNKPKKEKIIITMST